VKRKPTSRAMAEDKEFFVNITKRLHVLSQSQWK